MDFHSTYICVLVECFEAVCDFKIRKGGNQPLKDRAFFPSF